MRGSATSILLFLAACGGATPPAPVADDPHEEEEDEHVRRPAPAAVEAEVEQELGTAVTSKRGNELDDEALEIVAVDTPHLPPMRVNTLVCPGDRTFDVARTDAGEKIHLVGDETVELTLVDSKDVATWTDGTRTLAVKPGGEATVTVGDDTWVCHVDLVKSLMATSRARGASHRALGQGATWSAEVFPGYVELELKSGDLDLIVPVSLDIHDDTHTWKGTHGSEEITLQIKNGGCAYPRLPGGPKFPATAMLIVGGTRYTGCAQPL